MNRFLKQMTALLLCAVLLFGQMAIGANAARTDNGVISESAVYINPLYADQISEKDLVKPSAASRASIAPENVVYATTVEEAGATLREQLKAREESCVTYLRVASYDNSLHNSIFDSATSHTGDPLEGDYLLWHYGGYRVNTKYTTSSDGYIYATFTYTMTYYTTLAQEAELDHAVNNLLAELNLNGASEYQRLRGVYDYICENIVYDYDNLEDSDYKLKFSAYAAMINKTAVCQGYASLLYRLALTLGLDCRIVVSEDHAWNIVKIDNQYYNADPTWDAIYRQAGAAYNFFLRCNANFGDHTPTKDWEAMGYYISETDYVPTSEHPVNHALGEWVIITAPTCTEAGNQVRFCIYDGCDYSEPETIPATGHNYAADTNQCVCGAIGGKCGDNLTWTLDDQGILTVTGSGPMYQWGTRDAVSWYAYLPQITSVVLNSGVTTIGNFAFCNSENLSSVTIPNSVTQIGKDAFTFCSKLTKITLPESITSIGDYAFYACNKLAGISIPAGVTRIGEYTFYGCRSIKEIALSENITHIDDAAFYNCESLETVLIAGVVTIDEHAFDGCAKLKSVTFESDAATIHSLAFNGITTTCYYPAGNDTWTEVVNQNYGGKLTWVAVCLKHQWSDATCTTPKTCSICGITDGNILDHNYKSVANSPYYTTDGFCNGCGAYEPCVGNGTEAEPYLISNAGQLYWFATEVNNGNTGIHGKLTNNITDNKNVLKSDGTLNGTGENFRVWTPIGYSNSDIDQALYTGTFDGNNYTVSGLYFSDDTAEYVGLFGCMGGGIVKNVGIVDSYFIANRAVAGVVGWNTCGAIETSYHIGIENSYNAATIIGSSDVGGVVGVHGFSTITNCFNTGSVTGSNDVGGISGENYESIVENCYNTGTINGDTIVGGISGRNKAVIKSCYNTGTITGSGSNIGGIVGTAGISTITSCYNTGLIVGDTEVGGVAGNNSNQGAITYCYNTGTINGRNAVGSIAGNNNGIINSSYNTGAINGDTVGGIAGHNAVGTIENCNNAGNIMGSRSVGGLAGNNSSEGTIKSSYNTGTVSGSTEDIGGIVGYNNRASVIENCYNTGNIIGGNRTGGIAGMNTAESTISNSYSTSTISGGDNIGGMVGVNNGTVTNCYFNHTVYAGNATGTNEGTVDELTSGKTTEQFTCGEVAYLLNGDQSNIVFKQTIGTDNSPNFTGQRVYIVTNCGGNVIGYTNIESQTSTEHSFTVEVPNSRIPATCVATGKVTMNCAICEATREDVLVIDPNNHTGNTHIENAKDPTCGAEGYTGDTYCECGKLTVSGNTIPATSKHNFTVEVQNSKIPATCVATGKITMKCAACEATQDTTLAIDPNNHSGVIDVATAAGCETTGLTEGKHCGLCGTVLVAQEVIPSTGHTLGDWVSGDGKSYRECSACDFTETKVTTSSGTDVSIESTENPDVEFDVDNVTDPTDERYVLVKENLTSNAEVEREILNIFDITMEEKGVHVQPDGTVKVKLPVDWDKETNYKVYYVDDDGNYVDMNAYRQGSHLVFETDHFSLYVLIVETPFVEPGHQHKYNAVITKPTCTKDGYTTHTCSGCGHSYQDSTVAKLEHDLGDWIVDEAATCTTDGSQHKECSRCDHTETDVIQKLGHTEEIDEAVDPTCGETGLTEGKHCAVCGDILIKQETVPATGEHSFVDGECEHCGQGEGMLGDFTGDNILNDRDAYYLLRHTLLPSKYPVTTFADFNHDGIVNDRDAYYLLRHTLLPSKYPITTTPSA